MKILSPKSIMAMVNNNWRQVSEPDRALRHALSAEVFEVTDAAVIRENRHGVAPHSVALPDRGAGHTMTTQSSRRVARVLGTEADARGRQARRGDHGLSSSA